MTAKQQSNSDKSGLASFWAELKRRKVVRVAVAYAAVGWLVFEIATTAFPRLGIPAWAETLILMLVVLGFPIAIILAWAFQLTAEGIKVEADVPSGGIAVPAQGNKLNVITLGLVVLVLTFLVVDRYVFESSNEPPSAKYSTAPSGVLRSSLTDIELLAPLNSGVRIAISRDGSHIAVASYVDGVSMLFIRRSDEIGFRRLEGTEGADHPSFSPDGEWLAFGLRPLVGSTLAGQIKRVRVTGGPILHVVEGTHPHWGLEDIIVFQNANDGIYRVSPNGTDLEQLLPRLKFGRKVLRRLILE